MLFGPLHFVFDASTANRWFGVLMVLLVGMLLWLALRRLSLMSLLYILVAAAVWLACGEIGRGINV